MRLMHVTIDSGHSDMSVRSDQNDAAIAAAGQILRHAIHRPATPLATAAMLRELGADPGVTAIDIALAALHPTLIGHGALRRWELRAAVNGTTVLGTIFSRDTTPVLSFGVAVAAAAGRAVWEHLHTPVPGRGPAATDSATQPPTPWVATRLEGGAALLPRVDLPILMPILADLQRCIAWAWIDAQGRSS